MFKWYKVPIEHDSKEILVWGSVYVFRIGRILGLNLWMAYWALHLKLSILLQSLLVVFIWIPDLKRGYKYKTPPKVQGHISSLFLHMKRPQIDWPVQFHCVFDRFIMSICKNLKYFVMISVLWTGREIYRGPGLHEHDLHWGFHCWVCAQTVCIQIQGMFHSTLIQRKIFIAPIRQVYLDH